MSRPFDSLFSTPFKPTAASTKPETPATAASSTTAHAQSASPASRPFDSLFSTPLKSTTSRNDTAVAADPKKQDVKTDPTNPDAMFDHLIPKSQGTVDEQEDVDRRREIKLVRLNQGFQRRIAALDPTKESFDNIIEFYIRVRERIGMPINARRRKEDAEGKTEATSQQQSEKSTDSAGSTWRPPPPTPHPSGKRKLAEVGDTDDSSKRSKSEFQSKTAGLFASAFASTPKSSSTADGSKTPASVATSKLSFGETGAASTPKPSSSIFAAPSKTSEPAQAPAKPSFEPPKFEIKSGTNFFAQFGELAAKDAEREKAKRKAEEFDSEEENEEEWERKYAEAQQKKRKQLEEAGRKQVKFVPGKGFMFVDDEARHTEAAAPAETAKTTEAEKTAEPEKTTEAAKTTETEKPSEPAKTTEPEKPAEPAKTAEPAKAGDAAPAKPFASIFAPTVNGTSAAPSTTGGLFSSLARPPSAASGTGPSGTSTANTDAEDTDADTTNDPQINLVGNAGEEDEDLLHTVRSRALKFQNNTWEVQGVGQLRVLFNKATGRARIVLRTEPAGKVVLNSAIHKAINYKVQGSSVQFVVPRATGDGADSWALRVKTKEAAAELGEALTKAKESLKS